VLRRSAFIDLALALALGLLAAALRPPDWELAKALAPRPDALEFAVSALNLASGDGFNLRIGDQRHPPRYEVGYPLLLAGWYRATGMRIENAAVLNPLLSILGIVLFFAACRQCFGRTAAVLAPLLLVLSRLQIETARPVMSESFSFLLGCGLLCAAAQRRLPVWRWLIAGLLAAALGAIRPIQWPGIVAGAAVPLLLEARRRASWAYLAGAGLLLAPLLLDRWARLGAIWVSGYAYWLRDQPQSFSLDYLLSTPQGPGTLSFYTSRFIQWDSAWPFAAVALAAIGCWSAARARSAGATGWWIGAAVLALPCAGFSLYFFLAERYLVTALPFLGWSCAAGIDAWIRRAGVRRWTAAALGAAAIVQAGWFALRLPPPSETSISGELDGLRAAARRVQAGDVLIVDTCLALAAWEVPRAELVLLRPWVDEHYTRLAVRRIDAGARIRDVLGLAPTLFVRGHAPFRPAFRRLEHAWRNDRTVLLLLSGRREELRRLMRLRIWELRVLEREPLWVLAEATPNE